MKKHYFKLTLKTSDEEEHLEKSALLTLNNSHEEQRLSQPKNELFSSLKKRKPINVSPINSTEKVPNHQTFEYLLERVLEDASKSEDDNCPNYITKTQLQNLYTEAAKLKAQSCMSNIEIAKLIQLITLLRSFINEASIIIPICDSNKNDMEEKLIVEAAMGKITQAIQATLTSLLILTSPNLSSLVYLEDVIEEILVFTKYQVLNTIKPVFNDNKLFKYRATRAGREQHKVGKEQCISLLIQNISEIITLLSELLDLQKLTDSLVLQVSSLGISSFFTGCNILELSSIVLLTKVFSKYERHRNLLMDDILTSVSVYKPNLNSFKLRSGVEIRVLTALFLQLIQSTAVLSDNPTIIKGYVSDEFLLNKYNAVTNISFCIMNEFIKKATASKCEDVNYRTIFESFIHDLLKIINVPEWPAAELILNVLSSLLMNNLVKKNNDVSLRLLSLDYLGVIAASLKTYTILSETNFETINQIIEKIDNPSKLEVHKLQIFLELLLNYLLTQFENDSAVLYARHFYLTIWYTDVSNKISSLETTIKMLDNTKSCNDSSTSSENAKKLEILEGLKSFKLFIKNEINKEKSQVKLQEYVESDEINKICIYLLSKRPFYQNFNIYLSFILKGLTEQSIATRTKAMKGLASVVEIDPTILSQKEIHAAISHSFLDQSAQVREAAVDLVGKYILGQCNLILQYYDVLNMRILDKAISVRKRVIKILIYVCLECPDFPKMPEVYVKIINRIIDEESVVSLVVDVFHKIWFTPVKEKPAFDTDLLVKKIKNMTDALMISNETTVECFEKLLNSIFKTKDKKEDVLAAGKQIVDCLIQTMIEIERKNGSQERILSCTTMLYLISKIEPKLLVTHASTLQPYLILKCKNKIDYQILSTVGKILEQILPLIDHPSELFLARLEEDYVKLIMQHDPFVVATCISCLSSIVNNLTKNFKLVKDCFNLYYGFIKKTIFLIKKNDSKEIGTDVKPSLNRSLFVVGLFVQYFDFEKAEFNDDLFPKNAKEEIAENLFYLLNANRDFGYYVLKAFGSMSIRYCDLMLEDKLKHFYIQHLSQKESPVCLKVQILNNIENFLVEEDKKWAKRDEKWGILSKKENLKELSDINLGKASNIVQIYLNNVLECMLFPNRGVRNAALKLIQIILVQGVVFPLSIVPYLIATSTDDDRATRNIAEKHLQEIELKYPGYTHYKAISGVQKSFDFQKAIREDLIVRGFRFNDRESTPKALNSFIYTNLKTKQQKRSLIMSIIKQIEEKSKTDVSYVLYLADNLAYFPYRLQDEALFVIYQIDVTLSVAGTNFLEMFQGNLLPDDDKTDDEEEENLEHLLGRFPKDVTPLDQCINSAQGCLLLGLLKHYLMTAFGVNNEKMSKYSPSDKLFDKQISRKTDLPTFNPSTVLEKLSNSSKRNNKSLALQYLQLKSLMDNLDPDDFLEKLVQPFSNITEENIELSCNNQQLQLSSKNDNYDLTKGQEQKATEKNLKRKHKCDKRRTNKRANRSKKKKISTRRLESNY